MNTKKRGICCKFPICKLVSKIKLRYIFEPQQRPRKGAGRDLVGEYTQNSGTQCRALGARRTRASSGDKIKPGIPMNKTTGRESILNETHSCQKKNPGKINPWGMMFFRTNKIPHFKGKMKRSIRRKKDP